MFLFYLIEIAVVIIVICYYSSKTVIRRKILNIDDIAQDLNSNYGNFFKNEFSFAIYHIDIAKFILYKFNRDVNELTKIGIVSDDHSPEKFFYDVAKQAFVELPSKPTIDSGIVKFKNQHAFIQMSFEDIIVDAKDNVFKLNTDYNSKNEIMYHHSVPPIANKNGCERPGDLLPVTMSSYKKYFNLISKNFENDSFHSYLFFECMSDGSVLLNRCLPDYKFSVIDRNCKKLPKKSGIHTKLLTESPGISINEEDLLIHAEEKRKCMSSRKSESFFKKFDETSSLAVSFNTMGYFTCAEDGTLANVVECSQEKQNLIVRFKYMSEILSVPKEYFDTNLSRCVTVTADHIRPIHVNNLYHFIPYMALSKSLLFNPRNETLHQQTLIDINKNESITKSVYIPTLRHNSFYKLNEDSQRYELIVAPTRFIIFNNEFYPIQVSLDDIPHRNVSTILSVDSLETTSLVKWSDNQKACANMIGEVVLDYTQFDRNSEFNGTFNIVNNDFDIVPSWVEFKNRYGHNNFQYISTADLYGILNGIKNIRVEVPS